MTSILAFVVVLGILIFIHELGHFLVARLFGVGVEKFSLGFGPRIFGKTVGITDYRISAIPLGGYVKMVGDEPDAELAPEMIPLSFTHKHVAKRSLIVAAGPLFNLLLAVIIYFCFFCLVGIEDIRPVVNHVIPGGPADRAGIRPGDTVIAVNGKPVAAWGDINRRIADEKGAPVTLTIQRDGNQSPFTFSPQAAISQNIFGDEVIYHDPGFSGIPPLPARVGDVADGYPAKAAGLEKNDLIININGHPVDNWRTMQTLVAESKGNPLSIQVRRNNQILEMEVVPVLYQEKNFFGETVESYRIGISTPGITIPETDRVLIRRGPVAGLLESIEQTSQITWLTVVSIWKLIRGTLSTKTLGGPIMIAEMAGQQAQAGISHLIFFIAVMSINLGVLNFLPIPVLDGGHLLFFSIEAITGRPVSIRAREVSQQAGIFILLLLMIFVFYNDIARLFGR